MFNWAGLKDGVDDWRMWWNTWNMFFNLRIVLKIYLTVIYCIIRPSWRRRIVHVKFCWCFYLCRTWAECPSTLCVVLFFLTVEAHILLPHQFSVKAAFHQQLVMSALLLHYPIIEDNDVMRLLYDAHVGGYEQHRAVVQLLQQSLVNLCPEESRRCHMSKTWNKPWTKLMKLQNVLPDVRSPCPGHWWHCLVSGFWDVGPKLWRWRCAASGLQTPGLLSLQHLSNRRIEIMKAC